MKVAQYENTDYEPFLPPTRASLLPMSRFILIGLIFTIIIIRFPIFRFPYLNCISRNCVKYYYYYYYYYYYC